MEKYVVLTQKGTLNVINGEDYSSGYDIINSNVEGAVECIPYILKFKSRGIHIWINEKGKLLDLLPTVVLTRDEEVVYVLQGNIVFARYDREGETLPLEDEDIEYIECCLNEKIRYIKYRNPYTGSELENTVSLLEI